LEEVAWAYRNLELNHCLSRERPLGSGEAEQQIDGPFAKSVFIVCLYKRREEGWEREV